MNQYTYEYILQNLVFQKPKHLLYEATEISNFDGCQGKIFLSLKLARIASKLCQNAFQTIWAVSFFDAELWFQFGENFGSNFGFFVNVDWIWRATAEPISKSTSTSNFALDTTILSSKHLKIMNKRARNCKTIRP